MRRARVSSRNPSKRSRGLPRDSVGNPRPSGRGGSQINSRQVSTARDRGSPENSNWLRSFVFHDRLFGELCRIYVMMGMSYLKKDQEVIWSESIRQAFIHLFMSVRFRTCYWPLIIVRDWRQLLRRKLRWQQRSWIKERLKIRIERTVNGRRLVIWII